MSEILSCFDPAANPDGMLPVKQSIKQILDQVRVISETELLPLSQATGRILSDNVISTINVPQQTNSAMDGFAVAADKVVADSPIKIIGTVYAGERFKGVVGEGEAVEIMTGAPVPEGADSIIIKEACDISEDSLTFFGPLKRGQHVRQAGEDIAKGQTALLTGTLLKPQELGLIASLGYSQVRVYRKIKVAIFSTGDEVTAQGEELPENCIYDTNRFTLTGLLEKLGCEVLDLGIVEDSQPAMVKVLSEASANADVVISSGGVSMGKADYIKSALESVGKIDFWRIAMRPGRPLAFGKLDPDGRDVPFFGLPGNPVAVMVTFTQFVQPALRKLGGESHWEPQRMVANAISNIRSRAHRTDYTRGIYSIDNEGRLVVSTTGSQGSGILTSMNQANCFIEIGDELSEIKAGEKVLIQPFSDRI